MIQLAFHQNLFGAAIVLRAIECEDCELIHGWALDITIAVWTLTIGWSWK